MRETTKTPLSQVLTHLGMTQQQLGARLRMTQGRVSRIVRHGQASKKVARRIVDAIDPGRRLISELHVLYPASYRDWVLPARMAASSASSGSAMTDATNPGEVAPESVVARSDGSSSSSPG